MSELTDDEAWAVVARIEGSQTFERIPNYMGLLESARRKLRVGLGLEVVQPRSRLGEGEQTK